VDEIEVKIRAVDKSRAAEYMRLTASSMDRIWVEPTSYLEKPDPVTRITTEMCSFDKNGQEDMCFVDSSGISTIVQTKRSILVR